MNAIRQLTFILLMPLLLRATADAQAAAPIERHDAAVEAAAQFIGKPLILRCFCSEDNLRFDAAGELQGVLRTTDWTLAAVNVLKVDRKGPDELVLDGVRVALRFNPDRREWERHPLKDEAVHIEVKGVPDAAATQRALEAIFASAIERSLQLAMPPFWLHFFAPNTPWPADALGTATLYNAADPAKPAGLVPAAVSHKTSAEYTNEARRNRVQGTVALRLALDAEGVPQRISVAQPLGYGLDEQAVDAARKYRFTPAMLNGQPVPSVVYFREEFALAAALQK